MKRLRKKDSLAIAEGSATLLKTDGWANALTGWGTSRDKTAYSMYVKDCKLSTAEIEALYQFDALSGRIVDVPVQEIFKKGYEIEVSEDSKAEKKLKGAGEMLHISDEVQKAETLARAYGGCGLIMLVPDGQDLSVPLQKNAKGLSGVLVIDKRYLTCCEWYDGVVEDIRKIGYPKMFQLVTETGYTKYIHESRIVPFYGSNVDLKVLRDNQGWGYSALQRPYDTIRKFNQAYQSASGLLADASQAVFKMKGLWNMITSNQKDVIDTRMSFVDQNRSSIRAIVLDSDGESFERVATPMTGIPETIDRYFYLLSAAVEMPLTKLFGMSPGGLNSTGDGDLNNFYDSLASYQNKTLSPRLQLIYTQIGSAFGIAAEKIRVEWCALYQESEQEKAATKKIKADTDLIYANLGVLDPLEIRLNRFADQSLESLIDPVATLKELNTGTSLPEQKGLLTPSDLATVTTVNEARASVGLPPLKDADGNLTVAEFRAKKEAKGAVQGEQVAVKAKT